MEEEATVVNDEVTQAQELLKAKEQENVEAFQKEYDSLSKKYRLGLMPSVTIDGNGSIQAILKVVKV
jgi:hypothetical protein